MSFPAPPLPASKVLWTRRLFWFYCLLWIIEGSIRKWVLPQYSQPLLLVRDPVVLLIYLSALSEGALRGNGWLTALAIYAIPAAIEAVFHVVGNLVPLPVAVFGYRTLFLHLPLIWILPQILTSDDLRKIGLWVLWLALPLALLMVLQFSAGSEHWLNAGTIVGGGQIGSSADRIRPASIFSFITGPIHFYALCTAFCFAGFQNRALFPRTLVLIAGSATLLVLGICGSRGLVLGCLVVAAVSLVVGSKSTDGLMLNLIFVAFLGLVYFALGHLSIFQEGHEIITDRLAAGEGDEAQTSIFTRYFLTYANGFKWAGQVPLFGEGLGCTSNLASIRYHIRVPVETEWERIVYEIGGITAFPYLFFRLAFAISLLLLAVRAWKENRSFCAMLVSACVLDIIAGNFRQPTTLGYVCVVAGLCLVAARDWKRPPDEPRPERPSNRSGKGRVFAGQGPFSVGSLNSS